jgi:murein DD-endopeptidase MepM/ murein hydrolase activator NlpD
MKKGKIIIESDVYNTGTQIKGAAIIEGKKSKVYASLNGTVKYIDSAYGLLKISIQYQDFNFRYSFIKSSDLKPGQRVKSKDLIGIVAEGEQLLLEVSTKGKIINAEEICQCKVVHRQIKR